MIYHDQILQFRNGQNYKLTSPDGQGSLVCRGNSATRAKWYYRTLEVVSESSFTDFLQISIIRSTQETWSQLRRTGSVQDPIRTSGIWVCRIGNRESGEFPVGIYIRGRK